MGAVNLFKNWIVLREKKYDLFLATHSASPGSGKSNSSMEAEGMLGTRNHDNNTSSLVRVHTDYTRSKTGDDMVHIKVSQYKVVFDQISRAGLLQPISLAMFSIS